jgi:hypothetical protein
MDTPRTIATGAAGALALPVWGATMSRAAAKRTRDHPAVVALTAVLDDAAAELAVPLPDIAVQSLEARDWPDACLGQPNPEEGCAEVITPGFHVVLTTPAGDVSYRTDERGNVRREPAATSEGALQVHFARTGGIAGRHDELDLDTANLPADAADELRRLIEDADFWELPEEIDEASSVSDGYTYEVRLTDGSRSHVVFIYGISRLPHPDNVGFWQLVSWLEARLSTT